MRVKFLVVVILVALAVSFAGCSEEESVKETPTPPPTPTSTPVPTPTYDDQAFIFWSQNANKKIIRDLELLQDSASRNDLDDMLVDAITLKNDLTTFLSEIDDFKLSPVMNEVRAEYKLAMLNHKTAAELIEEGIKNMDADKISSANQYLIKGSEHMEKATNLLKKYKS